MTILKYIIIYGGIFIAGAVTFLFFDQCALQKLKVLLSHHSKEKVVMQFDESIQKDSTDIFKNDEALFSYVKKFGLMQAINRLHELEPVYGDCHQPAHKAGRFAYEIISTEAFEGFPSGGTECHSGGFHGAIEAYFKDHGTADLSRDIKVICGSDLNPFFKHQCYHGIGHGLMAWTDYELFEALKNCDRLSEGQDSCWLGVFMENIVGILGAHEGHSSHVTKYLNNDPHYPCTIVDDKYKSTCYFYQTSRMMQLFAGDFSKIASACSQAPTRYQPACFESMGRDVGGVQRGNPRAAISTCSTAPHGTLRIGCLNGAVQDTFWDATGQDNALNFCKRLQERLQKDACYKTIFSRALQILTSKDALKSFCSKAEAQYRGSCLVMIAS